MRRDLVLLLPLLFTGACVWWKSENQVLFTSDPLGAHISVDGNDTGLTTPIRMPIAGNFGANHAVTISKAGYRSQTLRIYQQTEGYTSKWIDGAYHTTMPPLPLFWSGGDFFFPFGVRGAIVPKEVHAKLYRNEEPKLGFEVLAEQAAAATSK